jgi:hypothetical protein
LYRYSSDAHGAFNVSLNGESVKSNLTRGYITIDRTWQPADQIELTFPMAIHRVKSHEQVAENVGKIAVERGPVVYCAEAVDNYGKVFNLALNPDEQMNAEYQENLLNGVVVVTGTAERIDKVGKSQDVRLIPYYAWNHRGVGEMAVWLPEVQE